MLTYVLEHTYNTWFLYNKLSFFIIRSKFSIFNAKSFNNYVFKVCELQFIHIL